MAPEGLLGQLETSLQLERLRAPKTAMVDPVLENVPMAPTLCLVREFWMAETKAPALVVITVVLMLAPIAS